MSRYRYLPLSLPGNIRLLRLLPAEESTSVLQCELFEYSLQNSNNATRPYEALSYVWGSEKTPRSVIMGKQNLKITENLHTALFHLRDHEIPRIFWIDAVCINQSDDIEKAQQIPLMAEIYARASRVVVWIGDAEDDSDQALEAIRAAGKTKTHQPPKRAISALLQRSWFRRIWVLQEVAAARHVLIMCGSTEIDGYAFCLGLSSLDVVLKESVCRVTPLIRDSIFRSKQLAKTQERFTLAIQPLAELVDVYHAQEATKCHDKIYALLGMSPDDLRESGLLPDYGVPWEELLQRLVKYILGKATSVTTWAEKEIAVIRGKWCMLGQISSIQSDIGSGEQSVEVIFKNASDQPGCINDGNARWTLSASAKPIEVGDLLCLLQGASRPTIIRLRQDHCAIVAIAATPPKSVRTSDRDMEWQELLQSASFTHDIPLVWNWESSSETSQETYNTLVPTHDCKLKHLKRELEVRLDSAIRKWKVALILGDLGEFKNAEDQIKNTIENLEDTVRGNKSNTPKIRYDLSILLWAAGIGYDELVELLLAKEDVNVNSKDSEHGGTPLSWAARNGHENVVKLLLSTNQAEADMRDNDDLTPLSWATTNGHEAVVEQLLNRDIDINSRHHSGCTPLFYAVKNGHEAVVRRLLEGNADINTKNNSGETPLLWSAMGRHKAIVKLLLEGNANTEAKCNSGKTPLWWAIDNQDEVVVKLLLEANADIEMTDRSGMTPLLWAAKNRDKVVVKLLLEANANIEITDRSGMTPLLWAAKNGDKAVVSLLLESNAKIDAKDKCDRTPFMWAVVNNHITVIEQLLKCNANAYTEDIYNNTPRHYAIEYCYQPILGLFAEGKYSWGSELRVNIGKQFRVAVSCGHEAVVKKILHENGWSRLKARGLLNQPPILLAARNGHEGVVRQLLKTGQFDVNATDIDRRTPLSWAAQKGHEAVIEVLLEANKIEVNAIDIDGHTPLIHAAKNGHEGVVELLLKTGHVDVNIRRRRRKDDCRGCNNQTPLTCAAKEGHEAVVKLLLEIGQAEPDLKGECCHRTPLTWAAAWGHEAVVKLLLETGQVNINVKDDREGKTPLLRAAEGGHEAIVKLLLETGQAKLDLKDKRLGGSPLTWAAMSGREAVVKLLLNANQAEADTRDNYGQTPLSYAAMYGHEVVVRLLLETGQVDVNSKDNEGRTPLSWAAGNRHKAVVKLLLQTDRDGLNLKDGKFGRTPLTWAARAGHEIVVKLLLDMGQVEADIRDNYGQTPLSHAAMHGREAVVRLLLETGQVDVNSKDDDGNTPLRCASENGHESVVNLLRRAKINAMGQKYIQTPLSQVTKKGHNAVVKLLHKTGNV